MAQLDAPTAVDVPNTEVVSQVFRNMMKVFSEATTGIDNIMQRRMHRSVGTTLTVLALPDKGQERFASKPNEDRVGELEALREFLEQAAAAFDAQQQKVLEPVDRLKQLLAAKDKRATLLEMAGKTLCTCWRCVCMPASNTPQGI